MYSWLKYSSTNPAVFILWCNLEINCTYVLRLICIHNNFDPTYINHTKREDSSVDLGIRKKKTRFQPSPPHPYEQFFTTIVKKNKTQGLQLRTVSESKISPLINPVNTRGTCWDKNYYYNIWKSVQRGNISNFIFIAPILTEVLAKKIKLTH